MFSPLHFLFHLNPKCFDQLIGRNKSFFHCDETKSFLKFRHCAIPSRFSRRLSENGYFPQSLCQAQIIILEILKCIPVVIIFAFLDLEKNSSFSDSLLGCLPARGFCLGGCLRTAVFPHLCVDLNHNPRNTSLYCRGHDFRRP